MGACVEKCRIPPPLIHTNLYRSIPTGSTVEGWSRLRLKLTATLVAFAGVSRQRVRARSVSVHAFSSSKRPGGAETDTKKTKAHPTNTRTPSPSVSVRLFLLPGRTLAQRLIQGDANEAIHEGLSTLLHQNKWKKPSPQLSRFGANFLMSSRAWPQRIKSTPESRPNLSRFVRSYEGQRRNRPVGARRRQRPGGLRCR